MYLGVPPFGQTVRTVTTITATTSQTTFTPTGGYTVGYCDVYYNGIKLVGGTDFTATDGLTVVLTAGATSGAVVEIITYGSVTITDAVRRSGDTFAGAVAINSTLAAGNTTITGTLSATANVNFDTGTLFVDGTNNRVGINNTAPTSALTVTGGATISGNVVLGTTTISANGGVGTSGQVLTSGATGNAYWSTPAGFSNGQSISVANVAISNTITFADSTKMSTAPVGLKNKIMNGDFRIWQRGTSFTSVASGQYTADRWQVSYRTAGVTVALQNNQYYQAARLTNTDASVQSFDFEQRIEDTSQFHNTTYTLSFYAKASTAVTLGVNIYANYGTGGSSQDTVYSNNVSLTTSRTKFTIALPFPDMSAKTIAAIGSGGSYVRTLFSIASLPASAWYEIDSVQVEPGSVATNFDYRPYPTELAMCQRYYEKSYNIATTPGTATFGGAQTVPPNTGSRQVGAQYQVRKRVNGTITLYSPGSGNSGNIYAGGGNRAAIVPDAGECSFRLQVTGGIAISEDAAYHWVVDSEL